MGGPAGAVMNPFLAAADAVTGGSLGSLFKAPEAPKLPDLPSYLTSGDADKKKADKDAEAAAMAERRARGRASTILTSSTGVAEPATTSKRMLLGG